MCERVCASVRENVCESMCESVFVYDSVHERVCGYVYVSVCVCVHMRTMCGGCGIVQGMRHPQEALIFHSRSFDPLQPSFPA